MCEYGEISHHMCECVRTVHCILSTQLAVAMTHKSMEECHDRHRVNTGTTCTYYDYYIIEYWRQRVLPMDCADEIFKIAERYNPIKRINIESQYRIQIETVGQ